MNTESEVRIGTSGWSYKEWERVFYPDSKTPKLSFYSKIFDTAEIDSTFYANPSRGLVLGWVKNTPSSFEFSVKLPKLITHDKKLELKNGVEIDINTFLELMRPLHQVKKLGALLIQLPPSFSANKRKVLEEFFQVLPSDKYRFAVEFRNRTWLKEKSAHTLLEKYHVANTIVDEPLLPIDLTPTSDFAFVRWHGRGEQPWYNYRYSEEEIEPWVERAKVGLKSMKKIYGYFNNHFHGYAIENGLEFMGMLEISNTDQQSMLSQVKRRIDAAREGRKLDFAEEEPRQRTLGEF
ncbi:MAG: DUF72 domain-containing protein [Nitrososphaerales archaeon]